MSKWSDIRDHIETILGTVSGIGAIKKSMPLVTTEAEYDTAFKDSNGEINFCLIRRSGLTDTDYTQMQVSRQDDWTIEYVRGYHDSGTDSEIAFQDTLDAILTAIETDVNFASLVSVVTAPQVNYKGVYPSLYGSYFCHLAEITFSTSREVAL